MDVTESGMSTDIKSKQPLKEEAAMLVTEFEIVT
tara:strand:+ start:353 stop:454 length:102 start_codon:yes stop_codon:yes gene_type:complete